MAKLVLKSISYGVEKIPDSWFERVPGGFFKEGEEKKGHSDRGSGQSRRTDDRDDGYRSEGGSRRDRRHRSSYDGGADNDRQQDDRRGPRRSQRRRRSVGDDRDGRDDGHSRGSREGGGDGQRASGRPPHADYDRNTRFNDRTPYPANPGPSPPPGAFAAMPQSPLVNAPSPSVTQSHQFAPSPQSSRPQSSQMNMPSPNVPQSPQFHQLPQFSRPQSSQTNSPSPMSPQFFQAPPFAQPPVRSGSISNGYVPYSDVYGQPNQQPRQTPLSPLSQTDGFSRPNSSNPASPAVAPPPQGYQQNPFAQEAPTAVAAGAGAAYTGQPGFINPAAPDGYGSRDSAKQRTGYDEKDGPYFEPPPPDRHKPRRDYSPSHHDARGDEHRSRSERRYGDERNSKSQYQGKLKSRIQETFDTSPRALTYGAVGAVAGGLVGHEVGHGVVPAAIGATIGALGTNAFQARERYADHGKPSTSRRKETRDEPGPQRAGQHEQRDSRRSRDDGYYSD